MFLASMGMNWFLNLPTRVLNHATCIYSSACARQGTGWVQSFVWTQTLCHNGMYLQVEDEEQTKGRHQTSNLLTWCPTTTITTKKGLRIKECAPTIWTYCYLCQKYPKLVGCLVTSKYDDTAIMLVNAYRFYTFSIAESLFRIEEAYLSSSRLILGGKLYYWFSLVC